MATKGMTLVGLDVHARQTHAAVLDPATGELGVSRLRMPPVELVGFLEDVGGEVRAVYEAGPTGFGLARAARERGLDVRVAAPGSIPRGPGDRVKTDRRDAVRLVRLLAAGRAAVRIRAVGRRRELPRPGAGDRGRTRRFDARPPPAVEVPPAPRRALSGGRGCLDGQAHGLAALARVQRRLLAGDVRRLPGRDRVAQWPPRDADRCARRAGPRIEPRGGDRQAALLPRHRHAL